MHETVTVLTTPQTCMLLGVTYNDAAKELNERERMTVGVQT